MLNKRAVSLNYVILVVCCVCNMGRSQTVMTTTPEITCGNLSCAPQSVCGQDADGEFWCDCHVGFVGDTCHEDRDECLISTPCLRRGICLNTPGSFDCRCFPGWEGHRCQHRDLDIAETVCEQGYTGDRCSDDIDECANTTLNACNDHQRCENSRGSYECTCLHGWRGVNCSDDINECLVQGTCKNNGTCVNQDGGFTCRCSIGWLGMVCEYDIDECQEGLCMHDATCTNTDGAFHCTCTAGWTGKTCDVIVQSSTIRKSSVTTAFSSPQSPVKPSTSTSQGSSISRVHTTETVMASSGKFANKDPRMSRAHGAVNIWLIVGPAVGGLLLLATATSGFVIIKHLSQRRAQIRRNQVTTIRVEPRNPHPALGKPKPRRFQEPSTSGIVMKTKLSMRQMYPR